MTEDSIEVHETLTAEAEPMMEDRDDIVTELQSESEEANDSPEAPTKGKREQKKFIRIRSHVQKLSEEFHATLYEVEQRHKKEIEEQKEAFTNAQEQLKEEMQTEIDGYKSAMASKSTQERNQYEELFNAQQELKAKYQKELDNCKIAMAAKEKELKDAMFAKEQELDDAMFAKEKELNDAMFAKEKEVNDAMSALERELNDAMAAQGKELNDAVAAKEKELNDAMAAKAAQEKELNDAMAAQKKELNDAMAAQEKELNDAMAAQEKKHQEALAVREKDLKALQKQEIAELYEQVQSLERSHKDTYSNAEHRHKSEIRAMRNKVADQESDFQEALVKVEQRHKTVIKELHGKINSQAKKHEEFRKRAGEKVKKLTQKLLEKHDDLEAYREKALKEVDMMAESLARSKSQATTLESSLEKVQKQYLEEYEKRKADEKKIVSLRKMIEQYDGGDMNDSACFDKLTKSTSDESLLKELKETPSSHYRKNAVKNSEEFEKLRDSIHSLVPDGIKKNFRQVGFYESQGFYFPVLGLSPFDIPPGSMRDEWLDNADKSLGIFYYGQTDPVSAYAMIPSESFIPYSEGVERDLHIVPVDIIEKQQGGQELTATESVFVQGIKRVNMEARNAPAERAHLLQDFEEDFNVTNPTAQVEEELEKIRNSLKVKLSLGDSATERATLMAEMDDIMKDDESEEDTQDTVEVFATANEEEEEVEVEAKPNERFVTDTSSSLDDQFTSFIEELSSTSKKQEKEESRDESRESFARSCSREIIESRDNDIDTKPSYEKIQQSSIVQKRLAMFKNGKQSDKTTKLNVETGTNTQSVMNMWKQKAAEATTPKQANVTPRRAFAFNDFPKQAEKPQVTPCSNSRSKGLKKTNSSSSISTTSSTASSRLRRVTIPKKIVMKIEAGEPLTEDEREILEGIQKFNSIKTPTASSISAATAE